VFQILLASSTSPGQALSLGTAVALLLHAGVAGVLLRQPARAQPPAPPILIDDFPPAPPLLATSGPAIPGIAVEVDVNGELPPLPQMPVPDVLGTGLSVESGVRAPGWPESPGPWSVVETPSSSLWMEAPLLLAAPPPSYPPALRDAGVEGTVVVRLVVDSLGRAAPGSLRAIRSDHPGFITPALRSLRSAKFRPARMAGRAVAVLVDVPVQFRLRR